MQRPMFPWFLATSSGQVHRGQWLVLKMLKGLLSLTEAHSSFYQGSNENGQELKQGYLFFENALLFAWITQLLTSHLRTCTECQHKTQNIL